jgi:hypothetical protein
MRGATAARLFAGGLVVVASALAVLGATAGSEAWLVAFFGAFLLWEMLWLAAGFGVTRRAAWARQFVMWGAVERIFDAASVMHMEVPPSSGTRVAAIALIGVLPTAVLAWPRVAATFPNPTRAERLFPFLLVMGRVLAPFATGAIGFLAFRGS